MGSVGDAYDNAMCESLFATLECELLDRSRFPTPADARREVFGFIEGFYNTPPHPLGARIRVAGELRETQPLRLKRRCSAGGNRSAPDFSWLFASSVMYVASLTGMTREKRNHIRHHQPQKPTVRESWVAPRRLRFLDWLQVYAGRLWSTQQGQGRREKRFGAWRASFGAVPMNGAGSWSPFTRKKVPQGRPCLFAGNSGSYPSSTPAAFVFRRKPTRASM